MDNDADSDVLITGQNNSGTRTAKLYTNDGAGNFTEVTGTPFEGVALGAFTAFADVDSDNDLDVLITGQNNSNAKIAKLYVNDGVGNFTEMTGVPFNGVAFGSSIAFMDIDGDLDPDVLITGTNSSNSRSSTLYTNDGVGNFTEMTGTPFEAVTESSIATADIDGDNDPDVLITGRNNSNNSTSKLYINNGDGIFNEVTNTPIDDVNSGSIAFSDVDGDNDQDLLITGLNNSFTRISKFYTNDGDGSFTEVTDVSFEGVDFSSAIFSDVDGDNDSDIIIAGRDNSGNPTSKIYTNQSMITSNKNLDSEFNFDFALYPNPTQSNEARVRYVSKNNAVLDVKIFDLEGRLLQQQQEPVSIGEIVFSINILFLNKGSYIIQLNNGVSQGRQMFFIQ